MPQLVVSDNIFIAQRNAKDALADHCRHRVLDQLLRAAVAETPRKPIATGTPRLAARPLVHRILTGKRIHWTVLRHATQAEYKAQIDDVLETDARDRRSS